jgi:hypothetical protein
MATPAQKIATDASHQNSVRSGSRAARSRHAAITATTAQPRITMSV